MPERPSYHDVIVEVDGVPYIIFNNYALQLHCTRIRGWSLWRIWEGKEVCIGEEYGDVPFIVRLVDGTVVCDNGKVLEDEDPEPCPGHESEPVGERLLSQEGAENVCICGGGGELWTRACPAHGTEGGGVHVEEEE